MTPEPENLSVPAVGVERLDQIRLYAEHGTGWGKWAAGRLQAILDLTDGSDSEWRLTEGYVEAMADVRRLVLGEPEPPEAQK